MILGVNMQTSFMHPPFGFALFYLRSVAPKESYIDRVTGKRMEPVTTGQIYWGAVPFVVIQCIMVGLVIAFPAMVMHYKGSWIDGRSKHDQHRGSADGTCRRWISARRRSSSQANAKTPRSRGSGVFRRLMSAADQPLGVARHEVVETELRDLEPLVAVVRKGGQRFQTFLKLRIGRGRFGVAIPLPP